jgi:hypothetical protein
MKEFYFRKLTKCKNQSWIMVLEIISWLMVIFTGYFAALVQILKTMIQTVLNTDSEADFIIPRTEEDMKREKFAAQNAIALETAVGFAVSIPWLMFAHESTRERYLNCPVIAALFYIGIVACLYRTGVESCIASVNKSQKEKFIKIDYLAIIGNSIPETIANVSSVFVLIGYFMLLNGPRDTYSFMMQSKEIFTVVLIIGLIANVLVAIMQKRKWKLDDYYEE